MKLYELTAAYNNLAEMDDDAFREALDQLGGEIDAKVTNIGGLVLNLKADTVAIKLEEERLYKMRKAIENRVDSLRSYLLDAMQSVGLAEVTTPTYKIKVRTNPVSVAITDMVRVPAQFIRIIPESYEVDKNAVKTHWKATNKVPNGCKIITDKVHLEIK